MRLSELFKSNKHNNVLFKIKYTERMEEPKFRIGEIVYDMTRPSQKLIISKIQGNLCHCKTPENMERPAIAYSERDLRKDNSNGLPLEDSYNTDQKM